MPADREAVPNVRHPDYCEAGSSWESAQYACQRPISPRSPVLRERGPPEGLSGHQIIYSGETEGAPSRETQTDLNGALLQEIPVIFHLFPPLTRKDPAF